MKLSVVVPVYNEKNTIEKIIDKVFEVEDIDKEVIIVDDGSTDGSVEMIKNIEKKYPGIKTVFNSNNRGKGFSLRCGFRETLGDYVIVQDADLEYDPQDYKILLKTLDDKGVDVVYGSRFLGNKKNNISSHYLGNKFLTFITNVLFGVVLTDMETCYKLVPGDFIRSIGLKSERFDFEPEITSKILKSGLKIKEVPISYKGRSFSEGKKITWVDGFKAVYTLAKYRFFN